MNRRHTPYTKFKAFLNEKGVKQSEVAKLLGKSNSALNQNLNGTGGDFSLSEVRTICIKYKISADEYFLNPQVSNSKLHTA
ncbi:helix-turn-helix transcriptional regulator [Paenibacillus agilis]|uniref:Helix-turn-helix transcriptional regulator n=1 Tax=Paenibacillus agilis TaxID=3020863 RepID=A0A559J423_9BACL|nr:helix-turn-helix transcriptional regulator [Paenibacillus agilis]